MEHSNLYQTKSVRLGKIKILPEMRLTPPGAQKLKRKYFYFITRHQFQSPVIVDRTFTLVDGYTTYLLARMFGHKRIEVRILPLSGFISKKEETHTDA